MQITGRACWLGALCAVVALSVSTGHAAPASPIAQGAACPIWNIEVDLGPRPGPARGRYQLLAALRVPGGDRLADIELELAAGQQARSERAVPGGRSFAIEVSLEGNHTASWVAELRQGSQLLASQRARVSLGG